MCVCVWKDLKQRIVHPRGMWAVTALPNGDLVTGCHDGAVRVFTRDPSRVAPPEVGRPLLRTCMMIPSPLHVKRLDLVALGLLA
jgi:hypothetical protein